VGEWIRFRVGKQIHFSLSKSEIGVRQLTHLWFLNRVTLSIIWSLTFTSKLKLLCILLKLHLIYTMWRSRKRRLANAKLILKRNKFARTNLWKYPLDPPNRHGINIIMLFNKKVIKCHINTIFIKILFFTLPLFPFSFSKVDNPYEYELYLPKVEALIDFGFAYGISTTLVTIALIWVLVSPLDS